MFRIVYRIFRHTKNWLIVHRPPVLTYLFFAALGCFERFMAARRERRANTEQQQLERWAYFLKYSRKNPPFTLHAEACMAVDTADTQTPRGAA